MRRRLLESRDQMLKLAGDSTSIADRISDPVGIERRPATVTRNLALHELPEREPDRRGAKATRYAAQVSSLT